MCLVFDLLAADYITKLQNFKKLNKKKGTRQKQAPSILSI